MSRAARWKNEVGRGAPPLNAQCQFHKIALAVSTWEVVIMPEAKRLLGNLVAEPHHVAIMGAALEAAWVQVSERFARAAPEVITAARTDLANGIIDGFGMGATDLLVLKHSGLTALRLRYPDRFQIAAE